MARGINGALLGVWIAALVCGCDGSDRGAGATRTALPQKLVIAALDGAAWRVIDPLLEAGELPNFEALIESGCRGTMHSLFPSLSPPIWTSVASGVEPDQHGIMHFVRSVGDEEHLYTSEHVRVPRFWELASEAGVRVGVTNYWFTYPAVQVRGFLISDHVLPSRSERLIRYFSHGQSPSPARPRLLHPPELWALLEPILERAPLPEGAEFDDSAAGRARLVENILSEDELVVRMALAAAAVHQPQLQIVYLKGIDRASHRFWREYEPGNPIYADAPPTPAELDRDGGVVERVYRHTDSLLGELRGELGAGDVLLVLSDHGFEALPPHDLLTGDHGASRSSIAGIFVMSGGPVARDTCPDAISLFDVAPAALLLLGQQIPGHVQGQVPPGLFRRDFLEAHPVRWGPPVSKASLSLFAAQEGRDPSVPDEQADRAAEARRLERLRALGYIE